jgi:serine/threonine protein kinase
MYGSEKNCFASDNRRKGALKKLHNPDTINKQRFEREIKILQTLKHKHIIEIIEWNLNGQPPVVILLTMQKHLHSYLPKSRICNYRLQYTAIGSFDCYS